MDILDYTLVAGKTIDGILLFTAGSPYNNYALNFRFEGSLFDYRPHNAYTYPNMVAWIQTNGYYSTQDINSNQYQLHTAVPVSDIIITTIKAKSE